MQYSALNLPKDLAGLSIEDLQHLAEDLRHVIINTCLKNGGHLGASLGTVELALGLHRTFNSPREAIIWDVGHQAYAHKLLTGRWKQFSSLRTTDGLSGFLSRDESEHDVFGAGHSSTSLSAALGYAWGRRRNSVTQHDWTVAVIGDGALTAGLALEASNNVRSLELAPLLVVLNDNQMSIAANVGGISSVLTDGSAGAFFAHFGFDYVGPVDGHDLETLLGTLQGIKAGYRGRPIVLHLLTQKGRGYMPAEEQPAVFHGVGPIEMKVAGKHSAQPQRSFSQAFGESLCRLAKSDPRVVAITAAMPEGTGLRDFARLYPDRFFDVGIAEAHAVTFAASLAAQGFRPVVAIYSTFLQRAYDAIIHDVALQNLPVIFAIDRAGLVGADGPTHHGAFDISFLNPIPGFELLCPATQGDIDSCLSMAIKRADGPTALRFPRGGFTLSTVPECVHSVRLHTKSDDASVCLVALGAAMHRAQMAMDRLPSELNVTFLSSVQAKPIPPFLIRHVQTGKARRIITVEEGAIQGGFGQSLAASCADTSLRFTHLGLPDRFIPHGSIPDLEKQAGIAPEQILRALLEAHEES